MTKLVALALIAFVGCGDNGMVGRDGEDVTADRHEELLAQVSHFPSARLCSGSNVSCARVRTDTAGSIAATATGPSGFGPADLAAAYGIPASGGAGISIAVVEAFNYPSAESDLATYRKQFGLPPCTKANGCLKVVNGSRRHEDSHPQPQPGRS